MTDLDLFHFSTSRRPFVALADYSTRRAQGIHHDAYVVFVWLTSNGFFKGFQYRSNDTRQSQFSHHYATRYIAFTEVSDEAMALMRISFDPPEIRLIDLDGESKPVVTGVQSSKALFDRAIYDSLAGSRNRPYAERRRR